MRKSAKNIIAIMAVLAMIVSFSACGAGTQEKNQQSPQNSGSKSSTVETKDSKKPVTLKAMIYRGGLAALSGTQTDPVSQAIAEQTGVTLDLMLADEEKIKIVIASNDLPDLMSLDVALINNMITGRQIIPLEDLIKTNGQNILQNTPKMVEFNRKYRSNNTDTLYCLSAMTDPGNNYTATFCPYVRWDYYKELGYPEVKSYDDYFNLLMKMLEKHPKNDAGKKNYITGNFIEWGIWWGILTPFKTTNELPDNTMETYKRSLTDPTHPIWTQIALLNKAQRMGVLDPETFTQKSADFQTKCDEGRYMGFGASWWFDGINKNFKENGHPECGYMPLAPAPGSDIDGWNDKLNVVGYSDRSAIITSACKTPDRVMDLLNFLWSYEGCRLAFNGIKGVNYDEIDGILNLTPETWTQKDTDKDFNKKTGIGIYNDLCGMGSNFVAPDGQTLDLSVDSKVLQARSKNQEAYALLDDYCQHYGIQRYGRTIDFGQLFTKVGAKKSPSLAGYVRAPAPDDMQKLSTAANNYIEVQIVKIIGNAKTEEEFEAKKQEIIKEFGRLGADKYYEWDEAEQAKAIAESDKILGTN